MTQCLRRVACGWKVSVVFSTIWKADMYWTTNCYFVHSLTARQEWLDSRCYAVLPYIYRHGLGKAVHWISNHGRTLFRHGGQSHGTHVMGRVLAGIERILRILGEILGMTSQHLMATISGNDKEMNKILVMTEALKKWDEVYGQTT